MTIIIKNRSNGSKFKQGDRVVFIGHTLNNFDYIAYTQYTVNRHLDTDIMNTMENDQWQYEKYFNKYGACKSKCCEGDKNCPLYEEA